MSRLIAILAGLAVLGGAGFFAARWTGCGGICALAGHSHSPRDEAGTRLPELDWLVGELSLPADQAARVRELHVAYLPKCAEMCERIVAAEQRLQEAALAAGSVNAGVETALAEVAAVRRECLTNLLDHVYRTAACMDERSARRYLDLVLPAVLGHAQPSKS